MNAITRRILVVILKFKRSFVALKKNLAIDAKTITIDDHPWLERIYKEIVEV